MSNCTYTFNDPLNGDKQITIEGLPALKTYLFKGGAEALLGKVAGELGIPVFGLEKTDSKKSSPVYKTIHAAINSGNVDNVLDYLSNNAKDKYIQGIAKKLQSKIPDGITLNVLDSHKKGYGMSYTNKDKAFKIFLSAWKGNENSAVYERALIHEFIHAATINQIDKNSKVNAQLKSIIDDLKSYAKNNQLDPALKEVVDHATENTYELIAYGLSDPSLQNLMQKIKASGDITIWDKLVRAISDMLGIEINEEQQTALSALLMVGDSLLGDTKAQESQLTKTEKVTKPQAYAALKFLNNFISESQLSTMKSGMSGEEGQFFMDKAVEMQKQIESMPETYGQDGLGDKAIAHLHYFRGGMDWYITEKDAGSEDDAIKGIQEQAFGLADLGYGGEMGYISIEEITNSGRNSAELDLYFTPKTIGEIKGKVEPTAKPNKATNQTSKPIVLNGFDVTAFSEKLLRGDSFKTIVQARKELSDTQIQAGTLESKKADEAIELAGVIAARQIVAKGMSKEKTFDALSALAEQMPSLNVRTSTSIAEQAYSTPLALAYVASVRAGIDNNTSVVEPTAGNGALLIAVNPDNAIVNELNQDRAKALESQGFTVTTNNAANYSFGNADSDIVIANPPFGTVKDDNGNTETFSVTSRYKTNEIDHAIAFNALKAMKDDGTAVLIVGGVMTNLSDTAREDKYNGAAKRAFYGTLYNECNVTDHFTVSGDLYAKQGAGYPVDVIVIKGKGKSELLLPAASLPRVIQSTEELKNELQDNRASLSESREATKQTVTAGATGNNVASGTNVKQSGDSIANKDGRGDNGVQSGLGRNPNATRGNDTANEQLGNSTVSRPNGTNKLSDTSTTAPQRIENSFQAEYTPSSGVNSIGTLVPVNMQSAINTALAKLSDKYTSVDNFVASQLNYETNDLGKYFSAEQVDAIALALDNIINGKGFIIGDQTGVGKGRVNAAMIRYAILNNITPIFVTEKPNLYSDMIRDLNDIGMGSVMPFATNSGSDGVIPLNKAALEWDIENSNAKENRLPTPKIPSDAIFAKVGDTQKAKEMAQMAYDGKLSGYDAVFTTYSQMQTIKGTQTDRMDFIEAMSKGALLILDESHNAGGTSVASRKGAANGGSGATVEEGTKGGRAGFTRQLVQNSQGVFYSSATYAKRPDVLDLYSKTDMGLIADPQELKDSLQAGGVPLQQAVASMLAQAGQYIRREKSFDGIVYDTVFVDVDRVFAERASEIMRDIMQFDVLKASAIKSMDKELKADARKMSSDRSTGSAGASSSNFTSVMHNMIGQMLLMLKVQPAIDEALAALKRGEKPVITLSNTMGSAIDEYAEDAGLNVGDAIGLHFGDLLARYLSKSRRVVEGDMYGKKESRYLNDEELGVVAAKFYKDVMDKIDRYGFDKYAVSPIDAIHNALHQAGYKTGEITGRNSIIDYSENTPVYKKRPASQKNSAGKRKTISDFNNGMIDAVILNQSGATGLSLHSSPKVGTDTRKRHMIIAQPELNIDTHMQMLGRVNRTGQSNLPSYGQLTANIPAEKRPSAILAKKMAGLNAATTAGKDSAVKAKDVPDFMNDYGDEVAAAVMNDSRDIHALLGSPLKEKDTTGFETDGAMRRVTGRIPILSLADQEKVYTMLEDAYDEYIDMLNKTGQNQLEAKAMALDAKTTATTQVVKPTSGSDSPFAEGVNAEIVDAKRLGKPYSVEQITQLINDKTGITDGASLREWRETQLKAVRQAYDARMAEINAMPTEDEQDIKQKRGNTDMLDAWSGKLITFINSFSPTKQVLMFSPTGGQYLGFVGNLERKGDAKNYFALGNWKLTVYVADAAKSFTIPLSKITAGSITEGKWSIEPTSQDIKKAIEEGSSESREERTILTGNMLAAYAFDKSGQIVNYTNNQGETKQGILMPKKFDLEKALDDKPVVFQTARIAQSFIGGSTVDPAFGIRSADNQLRIIPQQGNYSIRVPASKAQGGQYFLNPRLIRAVEGENFVKRGNEMVGTFNKESLGDVLDILYPIAGKLQPISKDKGKGFLESTEIKPSKSTQSANTYTKSTLTSALRTAMDREYGSGWTQRLFDTGKFKIVSREEANEVISGGELFSQDNDKSYVTWSLDEDDIYDDEGDIEDTEEYALIDKIYVPVSQRGSGEGKRLLLGAIKQIQTEHPNLPIKITAYPFGEDKMDMTDLVDWYERMGFDVTNTDSHAVIMEYGGKDLRKDDSIAYSKNGKVQAFYNPADDTTYFVAENIDKNKDLLGLARHEIGVHALQLGKNDTEFYGIMEQMLKIARISKPAKQALATALESFGITKVPEQDKPELVMDDNGKVIASVTREQVLHELGGYIVEHHPKLGIVQKFLVWFKSKLRALGKALPKMEQLKWVRWANSLNESDLVSMASGALKSAPDTLMFDSVGRGGEAVKLSESGKLLAPNGKPSNLNAMQYAQVRTPEFLNWFGDWINDPANASKVVDENGEPQVNYHQTTDESMDSIINKGGFKGGFEKASANDGQTPYGFFFKNNTDKIRIKGENQIPVFLNIKNPAYYYNRKDMQDDLSLSDKKIADLFKKEDEINKEYDDLYNKTDAELDVIYAEWLMDKNNPKFSNDKDVVSKTLTDITDKWGELINKNAIDLKKQISLYLNDNYDGVMLRNDEGGYNQVVNTKIAFSPNQIKSATANTGAFSPGNNDIRYSKSSLQSKITDAIDSEWLNIVNEMKRQGVIEIRC